MNKNNILFIGTGKMATAIAGGMIAKAFDVSEISAFDISSQAAENFTKATGIKVETKNIKFLLEQAKIVIVAVKPQNVEKALGEQASLYKDKLIISIVAGIKIAKLEKLTKTSRIIRIMPNTPALVGEGASVWCASSGVHAEDIELIGQILSSVGKVCKVEEKLMDAVTGLSGSGPAYVLDFIIGLAEGGVEAGLSQETANLLAVQTVFGTAKLLLESKRSPEVLRDEVTSPGGTTEKALEVLNKKGFKKIVIEAVIAAKERSKELGK
jgi:pyrroline-5-carboxylate reductase